MGDANKCLQPLIILLMVMALISLRGATAFSQSRSEEQPVADRELIKARKANEDAQAEYYRELTKKLQGPSPAPTPIPRKTFRENVAENPASVIGIVGTILAALFAALVGLTTLFVNSRSTARAQRDTQFYEALKRIGDKDSPTIRSSAAGLLAQMAQTEGSYLSIKRERPFVKFERPLPYFTTGLDQLITALLLEDNPVALRSISDGIKQLISYDPKEATEKLRLANLRIQEDLTSSLAKFFVINGHESVPKAEHLKPGQKAWDTWIQAGSLTGYDVRDSVCALKWFGSTFDNHLHALKPNAEVNTSLLADAQDKLRLNSIRLQNNVFLYCTALSQCRGKWKCTGLQGSFLVGNSLALGEADLSSVDLSDSQLTSLNLLNANMENASFARSNLTHACLQQGNLRDACLQEANLEGTDLEGADLSDTLLGLAKIDDYTNLEGTKWWKSNFGEISDNEADVDTNLFEKLCKRYGEPTELNEVHHSVRDYLISKRAKAADAEL